MLRMHTTITDWVQSIRAEHLEIPDRCIIRAQVLRPWNIDEITCVKREADRVIRLETPEALRASGYHCRDFAQVSGEEVVTTLRGARRVSTA